MPKLSNYVTLNIRINSKWVKPKYVRNKIRKWLEGNMGINIPGFGSASNFLDTTQKMTVKKLDKLNFIKIENIF